MSLWIISIIAFINIVLLPFYFTSSRRKGAGNIDGNDFLENRTCHYWIFQSLSAIFCVAVYLCFYPGHMTWNTTSPDKLVYCLVLLAGLCLADLFSPTHQLFSFFRKSKTSSLGQQLQFEEYQNHFCVNISYWLLGCFLMLPFIKQIIFFYCRHVQYPTGFSSDRIHNLILDITGFFLVLYLTISVRQLICQITLIKKGALEEDTIFSRQRRQQKIRMKIRSKWKHL